MTEPHSFANMAANISWYDHRGREKADCSDICNQDIRPWLKKIIFVIGVLKRTVVSDWRFDNLCGSHLQRGVDKTWPRPWPTLWPRPWPTLWRTLWPTGARFLRTSLSIALNLCKQRAPSICHTYDSLLSSLLSVSQSNFLSRLVVLCDQENKNAV